MKNKFLILMLSGVLFLSGCVRQQEVVEITIQTELVNARFMGNGVQWSAYPHADSETAEWGALMTEAKWQKVFKRLDYMKPRLIRVMDQAHWRYYQGLDAQGNPILDFSTPEVAAVCKLLDYCERNNISVILGEWGSPDNGIRPQGIVRADDVRWPEMISRYLEYLLDVKGYTCIRYYNFVNEPNGNWASTDGDWVQWKRGYRQLHRSLVKHELDDRIALVGPDVVANFDHRKSNYKGEDWVKMTADSLADITALYDVHPYPDQNTVRSTEFFRYYKTIRELTREASRPFILGEIGLKYKGELGKEQKERALADTLAADEDSQMFVYEYFYGIDITDALIQSMLAGYSGAIAWDLDDAMHTQGDTGNKRALKRWGMWNILGTEFGNLKDENIRPWFYPWALMCRYYLPGMKIFGGDSVSVQGIRVVAGKKNLNYTITLLNSSELQKSVHLNWKLAKGKKEFKEYLFSEQEAPVDEQGFPVVQSRRKIDFSGEGGRILLPPRSCVVLTNVEY